MKLTSRPLGAEVQNAESFASTTLIRLHDVVLRPGATFPYLYFAEKKHQAAKRLLSNLSQH